MRDMDRSSVYFRPGATDLQLCVYVHIIYTPANKVWGEVYWFYPVCLSVAPYRMGYFLWENSGDLYICGILSGDVYLQFVLRLDDI